jgi:cytochrome c556
MMWAPCLALAALVLSTNTAAQTNGRAAVIARHQQLDALLAAYKQVKRELATPQPEMATIRLGAARMSVMARRLPAWFPPGSGPEAGVETSAKPEIWTNFADFRVKAAATTAAVDRLVAAAGRADIGAVRDRFREVSETCNACHRIYEERF